MDNDTFYQNGKPINDEEAFDESGALKTGVSMRVSMQFMDGLDPVQREVATHANLRDARRAVKEARAEMIDTLTNAWRAKDAGPAGAYPYDARLEGTSCTINGAPGTLQRRGDASLRP